MGTPIKVGRVWLEFYYPYAPPPEWERFGIEITEDYVALLHRPVDARNVSRVENTLWPQRALWSFWASFQVLWRLESARFREMWELLEEDHARQDQETTNDPTQGPPSVSVDKSSKDRSDNSASAKSIQIAGKDNRDKRFSLPLLPLPQPSPELKGAMLAFRRFYRKGSSTRPSVPPRGSLLCAGLIELVGTRDILVIDVQAFYNPEMRAITFVDTHLQSARPAKLAPRGRRRRDDDEEDVD
jgi:hypothetical protein